MEKHLTTELLKVWNYTFKESFSTNEMCDRSFSLMSLQTCIIVFILIFMDCLFYTMSVIGESDNMSALTPH